MSTEITVAAMVRNEAQRYLPSALSAWSEWADQIVLLDDGSEDGGATEDLAAEYPDVRYSIRRSDKPAWGAEAPARAELWQLALAASERGDWIFVLDADMVPAHDPRELPIGRADALFFNLYDLWDETEQSVRYRTDGHWKAHENWRCWAVRYSAPPADGWQWPERGIHCGHFPQNHNIYRPLHMPPDLYAPLDYGLLHYAYLRSADRKRKYLQYADTADQLSEDERRHAESILDDDPRLASLPFEPQYQLTYGR